MLRLGRATALLLGVGLPCVCGCGRAETPEGGASSQFGDAALESEADTDAKSDSMTVYCDNRMGPIEAQAPDAYAGIYACSSGFVCCQSGGVPGWACRPPGCP